MKKKEIPGEGVLGRKLPGVKRRIVKRGGRKTPHHTFTSYSRCHTICPCPFETANRSLEPSHRRRRGGRKDG